MYGSLLSALASAFVLVEAAAMKPHFAVASSTARVYDWLPRTFARSSSARIGAGGQERRRRLSALHHLASPAPASFPQMQGRAHQFGSRPTACPHRTPSGSGRAACLRGLAGDSLSSDVMLPAKTLFVFHIPRDAAPSLFAQECQNPGSGTSVPLMQKWPSSGLHTLQVSD